MSAAPSQQQLQQLARSIGRKLSELRTVHTYTDCDGVPQFFKLRFEHDSTKTIRPARFVDGEFVLGEPPFAKGKPLYGLTAILANQELPVVLCEGEKAADALTQAGICATTSGGSTSALKADWSPLANRTVLIWPDADEPGMKYAVECAAQLADVARSVTTIDPFKISQNEGDDAYDWLQKHCNITYAQLFCFVQLARDTRVPADTKSSSLSTVDVYDFLQQNLPTRGMLLAPIISEQSINQLYGWRGCGKTFVALEIAWAVATGTSAFGWTAESARRVIYLDGEMPCAEIQKRLKFLQSASARAPAPGYFHLLTPDLQLARLPDLSDRDAQASLDQLIGEADLIIVDNISSWVRGAAGRENDGESWVPVGEWALEWRRKGKAILFVHHSGKGGAQRGTSRREDILDLVIALRQPADYEPSQGCRVEFRFEKSRHVAGDALKPFVAQLHIDDAGRRRWQTTDAKSSQESQVLEFLRSGMSQTEIARELGVNRSTICRAEQKLRASGDL